MQAAKGADQAAPIQIRLNISDDLALKLTALHLLLAEIARTCKLVDVSVCAGRDDAQKPKTFGHQPGNSS